MQLNTQKTRLPSAIETSTRSSLPFSWYTFDFTFLVGCCEMKVCFIDKYYNHLPSCYLCYYIILSLSSIFLFLCAKWKETFFRNHRSTECNHRISYIEWTVIWLEKTKCILVRLHYTQINRSIFFPTQQRIGYPVRYHNKLANTYGTLFFV